MELGDTVIAMTGDTEPGWREEYHRWYDQEHLVERMAVRGFLGARRYVNIRGEGPAEMTLYELESPEVLEKPEYRRLFNPPTDWSQRISQHIKLQRGVFKKTFSLQGPGDLTGKALSVVWGNVEEGWDDQFNRWYNEEHLQERIDVGYLSARRFEAIVGDWKYLAVYELPDEVIMDSTAYKNLMANRSEWTQKMQGHMTLRHIFYRQGFAINGRWTPDGEVRERLA